MRPPPIPRPLALLLVVAVTVGVGIVGSSGPALAADTCSFPVTATDATGTAVTISERPAELATLAPSAAQTVWEIGAKDRVTGVSTNAAYLSGTGSLTKITTYPGVDIETVVDLDPDLVLAPNAVWDEDVEKLRDAGLTVYKFEEAGTIEDVYDKTTRTGRLVGACDGARRTVASMREDIETARDAVEGKERPRVFYHMGGGWTAGSDTFIDEIIGTAGGSNVAASAGISSYQVMSAEVLIREDPEWFIRTAVPVPESSPYSETTAGRREQVIVVDSNYMNQPAPRIVRPIETIVEALYPDVEIDLSGGSGVNADLTDDGPTYSTTTAGDGTVTLAVSGQYIATTTAFPIPDDAGVNGDGVRLRSVDLTLDRPNPAFELVVRRAASDQVPDSGDPRVDSLVSLSVTANGVWPDEIRRATLHFTVNRSALTRLGIDPSSLALHRADGDRWRRANTTVRATENGTIEVTARPDRIGVFALRGEPVRLERGATALSTERLADGVRVTARTTVENTASIPVSRTLELAVGDEVTRVTVTVEPNTTRELRLTQVVTAPGTHAVTLDDASIGEVTVPARGPTTDATDPTTRAGPGDGSPATGGQSSTGTPGQPGFGAAPSIAAILAGIAAARLRVGR